MPRRNKYDLFLSYSHADRELVRPILQVLQLNSRKVFCDSQDIQPGDDWRRSLEDAISGSSVVLVLWCCDSGRSEWVPWEIRFGQSRGKRIVPLLLCSYATPGELATTQWIDFRRFANHPCAHQEARDPGGSPPAVRSMSSSRKRRLAIYETAMVGGAGGVGALKGMSVRLPHDTGTEGWTGYLILAAMLVAVAGAVGLIEWWIRRKGITSRDDETVRVVLEELAKQPGRGVGVSP